LSEVQELAEKVPERAKGATFLEKVPLGVSHFGMMF